MPSTLHTLQTSIVERLQESLSAGVRVLTAFDLGKAKESQVVAPAVFVSYEGLQVTEYSESRKVAIAQISFSIIALARQGASLTRADKPNDAALELLESVVIGLTGFKPTGAMKPMKMLSADSPEYEPPMAWLPTSWVVDAMLPTTAP